MQLQPSSWPAAEQHFGRQGPAHEAAACSFEDLGTLSPERSWNVAYRPLPARYDPLNPTHLRMVLDEAVLIESAPRWLTRSITLLFLLAAAALLILAWPAVHGRGRGELE